MSKSEKRNLKREKRNANAIKHRAREKDALLQKAKVEEQRRKEHDAKIENENLVFTGKLKIGYTKDFNHANIKHLPLTFEEMRNTFGYDFVRDTMNAITKRKNERELAVELPTWNVFYVFNPKQFTNNDIEQFERYHNEVVDEFMRFSTETDFFDVLVKKITENSNKRPIVLRM